MVCHTQKSCQRVRPSARRRREAGSARGVGRKRGGFSRSRIDTRIRLAKFVEHLEFRLGPRLAPADIRTINGGGGGGYKVAYLPYSRSLSSSDVRERHHGDFRSRMQPQAWCRRTTLSVKASGGNAWQPLGVWGPRWRRAWRRRARHRFCLPSGSVSEDGQEVDFRALPWRKPLGEADHLQQFLAARHAVAFAHPVLQLEVDGKPQRFEDVAEPVQGRRSSALLVSRLVSSARRLRGWPRPARRGRPARGRSGGWRRSWLPGRTGHLVLSPSAQVPNEWIRVQQCRRTCPASSTGATGADDQAKPPRRQPMAGRSSRLRTARCRPAERCGRFGRGRRPRGQ